MENKLDIKTVLLNSRVYTLFGLSCIALGLSLSKPLISLGYIILAISWFMEGGIVKRIVSYYRNKVAVALSLIYLITLIGLLYSNDLEYGLDDTRRKMFLFVMPFLLSGLKPLSYKEQHQLFKTYVVGVLAASMWSFLVYIGATNIEVIDARDYSRFNSHIRFGLEIVLALFFSIYYAYRNESVKRKLFWAVVCLWLICSLVLFKLFTGTVVLIGTSLILMFVLGKFSPRKKLKYVLISVFPVVVLISFLFIKSNIENYYSFDKVVPLKEIERTENGGLYEKNQRTEQSTSKENGYYIEKNIAWVELEHAWNERSELDFQGKDLKGNSLRLTIARFITSKGQRKDAKAIEKLTNEEIRAIENGVPNIKYLQMDFLSVRAHKIIWEFDNYRNGGDYNGHSVVMRWVYWKTAYQILKQNVFFGVGTGDVQEAFNAQYKSNNSLLNPEFRLRAHNQFITYAVSFGVIGFIAFVLFLFYPMLRLKAYKNYLYLSFFTIIVLSMLAEDTLETQVGINLFVFFNSIFLVHYNKNEQEH